MSATLQTLKSRIQTLKKASSSEPAAAAPAAAAPVAAPAAVPPAAPTSAPAGDSMKKLANSITKLRATPPATSTPAATPAAVPPAAADTAPKVAGTAPTDDQLTKAQLEKLASDPAISEDFSKLASYTGALLLSTEAGRVKAAALIDEHRGQQIGAALMAKAAGYMETLSAEQIEFEKSAAEQARLNEFLNAEFAKLPEDQQEYVKRAHAIHGQNVGVYEREFIATRDAALAKSASVEDKQALVKSAFERMEILKSAYAGGADDMGAMIESAGPEGENIDGATIEGAPPAEEGGEPQFTTEEILMLIEQAVASGQITPEEGEEAKAALAGETSPEEQMSGPGAEEAKAAHALVKAVIAEPAAK